MTLDSDEAVKRFRDLGLKDAARQLDSYTQAGIFGDLEHGKIPCSRSAGSGCPVDNSPNPSY